MWRRRAAATASSAAVAGWCCQGGTASIITVVLVTVLHEAGKGGFDAWQAAVARREGGDVGGPRLALGVVGGGLENFNLVP